MNSFLNFSKKIERKRRFVSVTLEERKLGEDHSSKTLYFVEETVFVAKNRIGQRVFEKLRKNPTASIEPTSSGLFNCSATPDVLDEPPTILHT